MQTGDIFRMYFKDMGESNMAGEHAVCCPFPHKTPEGVEYMEKVPSAHVNLSKGVFHCKVCRALKRFSDGGMSEVEFYAKLNGVTYQEALMMLDMFGKSKKMQWQQNVENLLSSDTWMRIVLDDLKLTKETVKLLQ